LNTDYTDFVKTLFVITGLMGEEQKKTPHIKKACFFEALPAINRLMAKKNVLLRSSPRNRR